MVNVLTTTDPQIDTIAELVATNRPPWPVGVAQNVEFSPWDFVIRSVDDLAPFSQPGNIFQLPTGSYAFAGPVNLGVAQILVPSLSAVLVKGFGTDKTVEGSNASALWNVAGQARFESLGVTSTGVGTCLLASSTGNVRAQQCAWTGGTATARCVDVSGGASVIDSQSQYTATVGPVLMNGTGGQLRLSQCNLDYTSSNGISFSGSNSLARLSDTRVSGRIPIRSTDTGLDFEAVDCVLNGTAGATPLFLSAADRFVLNGTRVNGVASSLAGINLFKAIGAHFDGGGLAIDGNVTNFVLDGVTAEDMAVFVAYNSGVVNTAQISDCDTNGSVTTGINWPSANVPSRGLLIVGTSFGSSAANAFIGFTHLSGDVNVKACSAAGTLLAETPIVP